MAETQAVLGLLSMQQQHQEDDYQGYRPTRLTSSATLNSILTTTASPTTTTTTKIHPISVQPVLESHVPAKRKQADAQLSPPAPPMKMSTADMGRFPEDHYLHPYLHPYHTASASFAKPTPPGTNKRHRGSPSPGHPTTTIQQQDLSSTEAIDCMCGIALDDGFSIACDACGRWCHGLCFGITKDAVPDVFMCWTCEPRSLAVREEAARIMRGRLGLGWAVPRDGGVVEEEGASSRSRSGRKQSPGTERKQRRVSAAAMDGGGKRRRRPSVVQQQQQQPAPVIPPPPPLPPPPLTNGDEEHIEIEEPWTQSYVHINADVIPHDETRSKLRRHAQNWRGVTALSTTPPPPPIAIHPLPPAAAHNPLLHPHTNPHVLPPTYAAHTTAPVPASSLITPFHSSIIPSATYLGDPLNGYAHLGMPKPYVHLVGPPLGVALDARLVGGKGRFVRRGCRPNAVLRPVLCEGDAADSTLAFGIFATCDLRAGEEIVLGWEWDDGNAVHHLPALLECPDMFPTPVVGDHRNHRMHEIRHMRLQMEGILHALSSTFTTCACGARARECALTQMAAFVDQDGGVGASKKVDLGPLVGLHRKTRGIRTKERIEGSGGMGGVEIVGWDDADGDAMKSAKSKGKERAVDVMDVDEERGRGRGRASTPPARPASPPPQPQPQTQTQTPAAALSKPSRTKSPTSDPRPPDPGGDKENKNEDRMPPKMRKRWMHREIEAMKGLPSEMHLEVEGRVGLGIRVENGHPDLARSSSFSLMPPPPVPASASSSAYSKQPPTSHLLTPDATPTLEFAPPSSSSASLPLETPTPTPAAGGSGAVPQLEAEATYSSGDAYPTPPEPAQSRPHPQAQAQMEEVEQGDGHAHAHAHSSSPQEGADWRPLRRTMMKDADEGVLARNSSSCSPSPCCSASPVDSGSAEQLPETAAVQIPIKDEGVVGVREEVEVKNKDDDEDEEGGAPAQVNGREEETPFLVSPAAGKYALSFGIRQPRSRSASTSIGSSAPSQRGDEDVEMVVEAGVDTGEEKEKEVEMEVEQCGDGIVEVEEGGQAFVHEYGGEGERATPLPLTGTTDAEVDVDVDMDGAPPSAGDTTDAMAENHDDEEDEPLSSELGYPSPSPALVQAGHEVNTGIEIEIVQPSPSPKQAPPAPLPVEANVEDPGAAITPAAPTLGFAETVAVATAEPSSHSDPDGESESERVSASAELEPESAHTSTPAPAPPPTQPAQPKVKLSLRDFVLRKKRKQQEQEQEHQMQASPMSTTSVLGADESEGESGRDGEVGVCAEKGDSDGLRMQSDLMEPLTSAPTRIVDKELDVDSTSTPALPALLTPTATILPPKPARFSAAAAAISNGQHRPPPSLTERELSPVPVGLGLAPRPRSRTQMYKPQLRAKVLPLSASPSPVVPGLHLPSHVETRQTKQELIEPSLSVKDTSITPLTAASAAAAHVNPTTMASAPAPAKPTAQPEINRDRERSVSPMGPDLRVPPALRHLNGNGMWNGVDLWSPSHPSPPSRVLPLPTLVGRMSPWTPPPRGSPTPTPSPSQARPLTVHARRVSQEDGEIVMGQSEGPASSSASQQGKVQQEPPQRVPALKALPAQAHPATGSRPQRWVGSTAIRASPCPTVPPKPTPQPTPQRQSAALAHFPPNPNAPPNPHPQPNPTANPQRQRAVHPLPSIPGPPPPLSLLERLMANPMANAPVGAGSSLQSVSAYPNSNAGLHLTASNNPTSAPAPPLRTPPTGPRSRQSFPPLTNRHTPLVASTSGTGTNPPKAPRALRQSLMANKGPPPPPPALSTPVASSSSALPAPVAYIPRGPSADRERPGPISDRLSDRIGERDTRDRESEREKWSEWDGGERVGPHGRPFERGRNALEWQHRAPRRSGGAGSGWGV